MVLRGGGFPERDAAAQQPRLDPARPAGRRGSPFRNLRQASDGLPGISVVSEGRLQQLPFDWPSTSAVRANYPCGGPMRRAYQRQFPTSTVASLPAKCCPRQSTKSCRPPTEPYREHAKGLRPDKPHDIIAKQDQLDPSRFLQQPEKYPALTADGKTVSDMSDEDLEPTSMADNALREQAVKSFSAGNTGRACAHAGRRRCGADVRL